MTESTRLIPGGVNRVPGNGINSNVLTSDAANRAEEFNSPENLTSLLIGSNGFHKVLFSYELSDNNIVSFVQPSSPYTEKGVMIIAGNLDDLKNKKVEAKSIYDYPVDVQKVYLGLELSYLLSNREESDTQRSRTVITENLTPVTSKEIRTSRTIVLPPGQGNKFDFSLISDEEPVFPKSLALEQRILNHNKKHKFVENISLSMNRDLDLDYFLVARDVEPFGYSIIFDVGAEDVLKNISHIQNIMELHHNLYGIQANQALEKAGLNEKSRKRIVPQPSYRMYMFFNDDKKLEVIISPEFVSHAGVTEAAGLQTIRDPKTEPRFTSDELDLDTQETTQKVKKIMEESREYWGGR